MWKSKTNKAKFPRFKRIDRKTEKSLNKNNSFTIYYTTSNQISETFKIKGENYKSNSNFKGIFTNCRIPWKHKIKLGNLKIKKHRDLLENYKIKQVTISRNSANKWYISFLIETEKITTKPISKPNLVLGVDRNAKNNVVATSDNNLNTDNKELFLKDLKLQEYHKELSELQKKYSNVRENLLIKFYGKDKQNKILTNEQKSSKLKFLEIQISNLNNKIKNYTSNRNWNIANKLTNNAETIVFEQMNLKGMTKKAKANGKQDGTVKRKRGLNRVLIRSSLGDIKLKTEIKAKEKGGKVEEIYPKFTSQRCNCCGHINKLNRKKNKIFECVKCSHTDNDDDNAAKNIKDKYLLLW